MVWTAEQASEQRERSLDRAQGVRLRRAALKREIKAGRVSVERMIQTPPDCIETMTIFDLLLTRPQGGPLTTRRMLARVKVSAAKQVGELTVKEQRALCTVLAGRGSR